MLAHSLLTSPCSPPHRLLEEAKILNTLAGQTTLTAAFTDDIFALGTLVFMTSLSAGDTSPTYLLGHSNPGLPAASSDSRPTFESLWRKTPECPGLGSSTNIQWAFFWDAPSAERYK